MSTLLPVKESKRASTQVFKWKQATSPWFKHWAFILASLYFLFNLVSVSISGEFPLNDDWIYCWCVDHLTKAGELRFPASCAVSIFPIYFAALCCKIFGFSYVLLRGISLGFGLLGGAGLYFSLKEIGLRWREAGLVAAVFLLNPLFINLCFGFMTDVPALAMSNWFIYFVLRGIRKSATANWILAGICLCLSLASRQNGIVFLVANLSFVFALGLLRQRFLLPLLLLVVMPVLMYTGLEPLLIHTSDYPSGYLDYKNLFTDEVRRFLLAPVKMLPAVMEEIAKITCYLGLFCMPLLASIGFSMIVRLRQTYKLLAPALFWVLLLIGVPVYSLVYGKNMLMPFSQNLFSPPCVGTYCVISGALPMWSRNNLFVLTMASAFLAVLLALIFYVEVAYLVSLLVKTVRSVRGVIPERNSYFKQHILKNGFVFLIMLCTFGLLVFQSQVVSLDRYYLMLFAPVLLGLAAVMRLVQTRKAWLLVLVFLVPVSMYSTLTCMDCLSFNRIRWEAIRWLELQGVSRGDIDGGAEYNYLQNFCLIAGYHMTRDNRGFHKNWRGGAPRNEWRWWPVSGEKYIVAGSPLDGYSTMKVFKCWSPLKMRHRDIYVLQAQD